MLGPARASVRCAWVLPLAVRRHSTAAQGPLASAFYTDPAQRVHAGTATRVTPTNLSAPERETLEGMLRVDHAGEIAANTIYEAQANVFALLGDVQTKQLMLDMWHVEKKHLLVAEYLLDQHHARPSLLLPIWSVAGSILGAATAVLGKKAAMACTEAVETVIGEHYDEYVRCPFFPTIHFPLGFLWFHSFGREHLLTSFGG